MRIISLNCNGIRASFKKGMWEYLQSTEVDAICFQEVRAAIEDNPLTEEILGDYKAYWFVAEKKGYSGVGIVSKVKPKHVEYGINNEIFDAEGRVIRADFKDVSIISVYIPSGSSGDPRQEVKMNFLDVFYTYVQTLIDEGRQVVICGDYNIAHHPIDLKNDKTNKKTSGFLPEEREWLSQFMTLGLHDVTRELVGEETEIYSWWSLRSNARDRNVGWRLDYQLATEKLAKKAQAVEIPMIPKLSDHAPVVIDYKKKL